MAGTSDVGIIIPVYCKTEKSLEWLDECLKSAVSQDCVISIYDDGSLLDISPIVSTYIRRYNVIYGRSSANRGVSYARNWAVAQCDTDLIFPLDCDDIIVEGAINKLLSEWKGTPIYPDVEKFGNVNIGHYKLLDFHCDHLYNHVGFTSVNVLHSRDQWKSIGGWDNDIDFYEDGEYNARLLGTYCGVHYPIPLVRYRIHDEQRTSVKKNANEVAKRLRTRIRSYTMACPGCSKKRSTATNLSVTGKLGVTRMTNITGKRSVNKVDIKDIKLPIEFEGKVLVHYIGGRGRGKHNYRGIVSATSYRVVYDDVLYADPRDTREETDGGNPSMLVRIYPKASVKKSPEPAPEPVAEEEKSPRTVPEKEPVAEEIEELEEELLEIDPSNMTVSEIMEMDLSTEEAEIVLEWEKEGKSRKTVIEYLENLING